MKNKSWKLLIGFLVISIGIIYFFTQDRFYQAKEMKKNLSFSEKVDQLIDDGHFVGNVLIVKDNKLLLQKSYGFADKEKGIKNQKDTLFPIASLQKMITGALIFQLVEDHKLSLTTTLAEYYPEIPLSSKITIQDLLNHTSGIMMDEIEPNTILQTEENQIQNVLSEIDVINSNQFVYTNANYTLLAGIISKITGTTYEKAVENNVLNPLDMKQTYFWNHLPNENSTPKPYIYNNENYKKNERSATKALFSSLLGAGNLYMTTDDMWKYIKGMLNGPLFDPGVYQEFANAKLQGYQAGIIYANDLQYSEGMLDCYDTLIYGDRAGQNLVILFGNQVPVDGLGTLGNEIFQLLKEK